MLAAFLDRIWDGRGAFGELRLIGPASDGGRPEIRQEYVPVWDTDLAATLAHLHNGPGWDAYYGVLPRLRRGGKALDVVHDTHVLWADIDAKQFDGGKGHALVAVNNFPGPRPQIVVDSGGGYHAYWLLDEYVPFVDASPVISRIADLVGGDHVQDAPRVLRLPGTLNWKRGEPVEARLLRFETGRTSRFEDFAALLEPEKARRRNRTEGFERRDLPEWLVELIEDGAPEGQRSETCFKVCLWLVRFGRDREEIRAIFQGYPEGIGQKYHEKGRGGDRWLDYTLDAAEKAAPE